tara:strand:+ start:6862 stop:7200 length:339 start_codon:yes stop_codon:yes gene_type:complete
MKAPKLTDMQKRYIWLAGSRPELLLVQGRGYRTRQTQYAIDLDAGELIVFGYSNPCYFMEGRFFRRGQAPRSYILTDDGESAFNHLLRTGQGLRLNQQVRECQLKPRPEGRC